MSQYVCIGSGNLTKGQSATPNDGKHLKQKTLVLSDDRASNGIGSAPLEFDAHITFSKLAKYLSWVSS